MSQQYDYSYPPPPPTSTSAVAYGPAGPQPGHTQRTGSAPGHPASITTAFHAGQPQVSPPIYGSHLSSGLSHQYSPRTPSALNPQTPGGLLTPSSQPGSALRTPTMEPYNPRQWNNNRGQVSGSQMVFQQRHSNVPLNTAHVTGMEGTYSFRCRISMVMLHLVFLYDVTMLRCGAMWYLELTSDGAI